MNLLAVIESESRTSFACAMVVIVLHLMTPVCGPAAEPFPPSLRSDVPFTDHVHRHYRARDGLPSNWIYDIVDAHDGHVWIATHNGVARYDGFRFSVFRRSNTPQLPANDTRVLYESRDKSLWLGTVGGLARYRPGRPGTFESFDMFAGNSIHAVYEDTAGMLWVGTREKTWRREPSGEFRVVTDAPDRVRAICQDEEGTLWFGSQTGLYCYRNGTVERVEHPRLGEITEGDATSWARAVTVLLADPKGIWVGFGSGLLRIEDGVFSKAGTEIGQKRVDDLVLTRDGGLYAATSVGLYRSIHGGAFKRLPTEPRASCLMEDREGGLWVGHSLDRGLHYFRNSKVRRFLADKRVNCVYEDPAGSMWFGCWSGLYRLQNGTIKAYGVADGLPDVNVQTIVPGVNGEHWVGTLKGLTKWCGTGFSSVDTPPQLAQLSISTLFVDSEGRLWCALSDRGGYTSKDGVVEKIDSLAHGQIKWFYEESAGKLWIGHEYGLFLFEDGEMRQVDDPAFRHLNNCHFTCYCAASDGMLWLGTSGGIVGYQSGRFGTVTSKNGLAADYVDRILEDAHGHVWFAGRDGFFYVDGIELRQAISGDLEQVVSHRVEPIEGVPVSAYHPKGVRARDGTMWLAASRGVIRVSTEPWNTPCPPQVIIKQVRVNGETVPAEDRCEFLSGRHRLAIDFAVPSFFNRHNVRVKYRLDGFDADWIESDPERIAYYTDLAPGDYRFRVIAANGNIWNEQGATIGLTVRPRWWERTATHVVMALTVLGLGLFYVRYRTRRFRRANALLRREIAQRAHAEREARRHLEELARVSRAASMGALTTSIAHEVKQPLFAMISNAETVEQLLNHERPDWNIVREALDDIKDGGHRATEIIDRIRSLVRKDDRPKELLNLNDIIRDAITFLRPEIRRRRITVTTELDNHLPLVTGIQIELQQVVLNLMMNGIQAMDCSDVRDRELSVSTTARNGRVELAVRDSGEGLDESGISRLFEPFYTTKQHGIGMGLAINSTIIRAHGGSIWAAANEDRGATFRFQLPIDDCRHARSVAAPVEAET